MFRFRSTVCVAFAAALLLTFPGCGEFTDGDLYIDNGGSEPIVVEIDGEKRVTVAPGEFEVVRLDLGEHHYRVTSSGNVVYEAKQTLDYGDRPYKRPTFVLNPDNSHRYCEVSVVYGDDMRTERDLEELVTLVSAAKVTKAAGKKDDSTRLEWEANKRIRNQFRQMRYDLEVFGNEPYFRFETPHNILKPLPTSVRGSKYSDSAERSAFIRIPLEVNTLVEEILKVEEPTQEDLANLGLILELVREYVPFRK